MVCAITLQAFASDFELEASNEPSGTSSSRGVAAADLPFPGEMECVPQPFYRRRADGKPGREMTLNFKAVKLEGRAQVELVVDGLTETTELPPVAGGVVSCRCLLYTSDAADE